MRYADFTIKKRGGTLLINKEMWLQDYPPDVNVEWGPMSPKARRQRTVFLIPFPWLDDCHGHIPCSRPQVRAGNRAGL